MKIIKILLFILTSFLSTNAQSLSGLSGLFNIPTADLIGDTNINIGANYLERNHLKYGGGKKDVIAPFVTIGFLPFLEVSIRITRQLNYVGESHVMDRMFSGKLKFIEEGRYLPSITLGLHNPYSTDPGAKHFTSTYIVLSKNLYFDSFFNNMHFTLGYGSDIIKAADYQYIGLFGGMSLKVFDLIELIGEYDAERFNTGIRLTLFNHIKLLGGFMDLKHFSGGAAFSFVL